MTRGKGVEQQALLRRWFEMDVLDPLEAVQAGKGAGSMSRHPDQTLDAEDPEQGAAEVVARLINLWEEGAHFERARPWIQRGEGLLACSELPAHAGAAVCVHLLVAGMVGPGDLRALERDLPRLHEWVSRSESPALRMLAAAAEANLCVMRGHLHAARECLRDASYLLPDASTGRLPKLYLALTGALARAVGAELGPRTEDLVEVLGLPATLPLHVQLTARSHRVLFLARSGQSTAADAAADELRVLAIPAQRDYFLSYMHYALGVVDLVNRRPEAALTHADLAIAAGRACGSSCGELIPALLRAQALMDLTRDVESLALLQEMLPRWQALGYGLQLMSGQIEKAFLLSRRGQEGLAAQAYQAARSALIDGETLRPLHRSAHYVRDLHPSRWKGNGAQPGREETPLVEVQTLGHFSVKVGGREVAGREWGGRKTITLLCLLIAHGGREVPADRLCDALWPDSDGAQARQNLKVALWRLRRVGSISPGGHDPQTWVMSRHATVSLDHQLCAVDVFRFMRDLEAAQGDVPSIWQALALYAGDFLPDEPLPAVAALRDRLRNDFVQALWGVAEQILASDQGFTGAQLTLLQRGVQIRPESPRGHALLMGALLKQHRASDAMMAFYAAEQSVAWQERASQDLAQLLSLRQEAARLLRTIQIREGGPAQVSGSPRHLDDSGVKGGG